MMTNKHAQKLYSVSRAASVPRSAFTSTNELQAHSRRVRQAASRPSRQFAAVQWWAELAVLLELMKLLAGHHATTRAIQRALKANKVSSALHASERPMRGLALELLAMKGIAACSPGFAPQP